MNTAAGGEYGIVLHKFWTDPDIKRVLSPEQKSLLLYWFTGPRSNLIGLYYCPLIQVADDTGIPPETVREWTLGPLARFVTYDERTEEVLVHRAGRHRIGETLSQKDNRIKAIQKVLSGAHSDALVGVFLDLYSHWPLGFKRPGPGRGSGADCGKPDPKGLPKEPEGDATPPKGLVRGSKAPPKPKQLSEQDRTEQSSSSRGGGREDVDPPGQEPDDDDNGDDLEQRYREACVEFVRSNGYGATEVLIAEGEDANAWALPDGSRAPWPDRLGLLRKAHAMVVDRKSQNLRSGLRYVIPQQYDPFEAPESSRPKPGTEAARVRSEQPQEGGYRPPSNGFHRPSIGPNGSGNGRGSPDPPPPPTDPYSEAIQAWEQEHPEQAERIRTTASALANTRGPKGERAKLAFAESEYRGRVLHEIQAAGRP